MGKILKAKKSCLNKINSLINWEDDNNKDKTLRSSQIDTSGLKIIVQINRMILLMRLNSKNKDL